MNKYNTVLSDQVNLQHVFCKLAFSILMTLASASDWWKFRLNRLLFYLKPVNGTNHTLTPVVLIMKGFALKKTT